MLKVTFQKNMAIEFLMAVTQYVKRDRVEEIDYSLNRDITNWINEVEANISPFLENDLHLLRILYKLLLSLYVPIITNGLQTVEDLLQYLEQIDGSQLVKAYLKAVDQDSEDAQLSNLNTIHSILAREFEDDENEHFAMKMLSNPEELKQRLHMVLCSFYTNFFAQRVKLTEAFLEQKVREHRQMLEDNPHMSVESMLLSSLDKQSNEEIEEVNIYISYHADVIYLQTIINSSLHVVYGVSREQVFDEELLVKKQVLLLKTLADGKRLEMLKLLGEREWFGQELAQELDLTTATVSYHLSRLADLRIVKMAQREQNRVYFRLQKDRLRELLTDVLDYVVGEE